MQKQTYRSNHRPMLKTSKLIFLLILMHLTQNSLAQQTGKVVEQNTVTSVILHRPVKYSLYLPPGYDTDQRTYPVVYLLHGYGDDQTGWLQFGEVNRYADKAIADGAIPPMVIVMPDAGTSFYINSYDGKEKYEDFFIKEFMPSIEKRYRIKAQKQYRAVVGLSMGGFGSLIYALKYPDLFAAAAPLSAAVRDDQALMEVAPERWSLVYAPIFGGRDLQGKDRLTKSWYENSILKLVNDKSASNLSKVRYWIDCGDDDPLSIGNSLLHIELLKKAVPHEFRIRNGGHTWTYWRSGIIDALQFIGWSFRQQ